MISRVPWGMCELEARAPAADGSRAARNARAAEKPRLDLCPLISLQGRLLFSPPVFYLTVHRINWFPLSVSVWILGPSTRMEQSSQCKRVCREESANSEALLTVVEL